jgi:hypothetical protein
MYSLLCALAAAAVAFAAVALPTKPTYAVLPAVAALAGVYYLLARRHSKTVEAMMLKTQTEMQQNRMENAIRILQAGYPHAKWVFLLRAQIDGQIGTIHFMQRDFEDAKPMLEKAWVKHWIAKGMLAVYWFRKHKPEKAFEILDDAIAANKKEPMLYGLKAYMKVKLKDRDGARQVFITARKKLDKNEAIADNLVRLQNGQDLRMWQFGDSWWNFHLEKPSQKRLMKLAGGASNIGAKGAKKSMYK